MLLNLRNQQDKTFNFFFVSLCSSLLHLNNASVVSSLASLKDVGGVKKVGMFFHFLNSYLSCTKENVKIKRLGYLVTW